MLIQTLSTFPGMFASVMGESMMKRAQESGIITFQAFDLRDWTYDRHRTTDDYPYGGGAGLVMKCEPVFEAVEDILAKNDTEGDWRSVHSLKQSSALRACGTRSVNTPPIAFEEIDLVEENASWTAHDQEGGRRGTHKASSARRESPSGAFAKAGLSERLSAPSATSKERIVFLSPVGRQFDDAYACELSACDRLLFVCGHYEGMDERVYSLATDIISLGDYVLTSGELASMVVIDAVVRKIPGVLGAEGGAEDESYAHGLLEYPQYTRPAEFRGMRVPEVLLSGHHANIEAWRRQQSIARTAALRPDLIDAALASGALSADELEYLETSD